MKRKKVIIFAVLISMMIGGFDNIGTSKAATGSATVYHYNDPSPSGTSLCLAHLSDMGYSTSTIANASNTTLLNAFTQKKVVHIVSHGREDGTGFVTSSGYLRYSDVQGATTSNNCKLVFLQVCYSSNMASIIYTKKAQSAVGFTQPVSWIAGTSNTGIKTFAQDFYRLIEEQHISVSSAASSAKVLLYSTTGKYWGTDSMVIKGGSTTIY